MKYSQLIAKIKELEKVLFMRDSEISDAHKKLDELDVPRNKLGAFVGHRLHWYLEGKRQSYQTKENTEGYPPSE